MAHPKRRHSKSRRDKRRTHQKLSLPEMNKCDQCGAAKLAHRVCTTCGYYKGEQVLDIEKREQKRQKKREKK